VACLRSVVAHHSNNQPRPHIRELVRLPRTLGVRPIRAKTHKEIVHLEETGDLSGIIAEDQTAHAHKDAHHNNTPSYKRIRCVVVSSGVTIEYVGGGSLSLFFLGEGGGRRGLEAREETHNGGGTELGM